MVLDDSIFMLEANCLEVRVFRKCRGYAVSLTDLINNITMLDARMFDNPADALEFAFNCFS